ncbi:MAG: DUF5702 domain-containing protein [Lachnospiraceae bacterium]|nr:DUF5702 domain-containing protein [Lachnospiraceae bacterium]
MEHKIVFPASRYSADDLVIRADGDTAESRAVISIYLALVLTVMLSLVLTLIQGARVSAIRMEMECVTDMGMNSAFAEFHRELLNQYDVFFIDTSYGTGSPDLLNTALHMKDYMSYNYQVNKGFVGNKAKDWLGIEVSNVDVQEVSFATDMQGAVLKKQAIQYMEDKTGLDQVDKILSHFNIMRDNQLDTRDITSENNDVEHKLQNLEREEDGKKKKIHIDSPANGVNDSKSIGILGLLLKDTGSVSTQAVQLEEYVQRRELQEGVGIPPGKELKENSIEEILFGKYLAEKCGSYTQKKEGSLLQYEIEYLLTGKNCDRDNLSSVTNKLVLIRQVANSIHLWSDAGKVGEADAAAMAIASAVLMPEIQPIVKLSLMLAWAYAESIGDVRILLDGGKIPLMKTHSDWRLQFDQIADFRDKDYGEEDSGKGLSYTEYLELLLLPMDRDLKVNRLMDVIEMDIRMTDGNKAFRMDGCIDYMVAEVLCKSKFGYEYSIRRPYYYE